MTVSWRKFCQEHRSYFYYRRLEMHNKHPKLFEKFNDLIDAQWHLRELNEEDENRRRQIEYESKRKNNYHDMIDDTLRRIDPEDL